MDAKVNAPELLGKQLTRAKKGAVWISSVCDPYQPLEAKYRITRQCLMELIEHQFPVFIQTKSKLVLRDLDLFKLISVAWRLAPIKRHLASGKG